MTDATLLRAVRHNCWANVELIRFCSGLSPEQLAWTVPGTYGSIHATLQHIVGAEHGYLHALTGDPPPGGFLAPGSGPVPLDDLLARARSNAERMESYLASGADPDRRITRPSGTVATADVIAAQFIHHGSDHRAHVGSILGAHGVEPPNLDVWAHGLELGLVTRP
ncbi:MAG: DinB family protein [Candidatus Limnocylindria bacterium]